MYLSRRSFASLLFLCVVALSSLLSVRYPFAQADASRHASESPKLSVAAPPPLALDSPAVSPSRAQKTIRASALAPLAPSPDFAATPAPPPSGAYGDIPLAFERNQGQTDPRVQYLARGKRYTLFLTPGKAVLALRYPQPAPSTDDANSVTPLGPAAAAAKRLESHDPIARAKNTKWSQSVLSLEFASSRPRTQTQTPRIEAIEQLPTISNYYIGNDPAQWHAGVPNFRKVVYRDAYPGVDVAYYGNPTQLETDFVVKPGANPHTILLRAKGASGIRPSGDGGLILSTSAGDVRLQKPVAYQQDPRTGARREIAANYSLRGPHTIAFDVAAYDPAQPLVIDPTLAFSTYLGGSTNDEGLGIAVDAAGEAYVTGFTQSSDFPPVAANQGTLPGNESAYVTKFAANGASLVFSTFLGGTTTTTTMDEGFAIAVDSAGSAYVAGLTESNNFPLKLPLSGQDNFQGSACAFVSEFSSTGTLTFSTYLCGGTADEARGIAVDANKNIYLTGATESTGFTPVNPIQGTLQGPVGAFAAKLAPVTGTGSSVLFFTYISGNGRDQGRGIAVEGNNIFVAGSSSSTSGFPIVNAFQSTNGSPGGGQNGFIGEINVPATGASTATYFTFIGGSEADDCTGIAVDAAGNAYVVGTVQSPDFPLKNTLQALDSQGDAFVAKVAAGGGANSLDFSTAFGGGGEFSGGIALDNSANPPNIYFDGMTGAVLFPTRIPLQAIFPETSGDAAFVSELKNDGSDYIFSTYLQGSDALSFQGDQANAIAVDSNGNAYVTGDTTTLDFPTVDPFDGTLKVLGTDSTAFVSKISPATPTGDQVFPGSLNFGDVVLNEGPKTQIVTLVAGSNDATISNVTLTGPDVADFTEFTTCGADVPTTVVCNFNISFTPGALGTRTAALTITEPSITHTINITGTGTNTAPAPPNGTLTFNNAPLTFGSQEVNTQSAAQNFSVTITGTVPVTFEPSGNALPDPNDFEATSGTTNPCPFFSPIQPGTTCNVGVVFRPTATGTRTTTVQLSGNFTTSPLGVPVSGTAVPEIAILSPTFLTFAPQLINTTSASQPITLTNMGGGPSLTVQNITFSGPFSGTGSCFSAAAPVVLANGQTCTINVTFTPTAAGTVGGGVTVQDSDPQNPTQTASFNGTGLNNIATLLVEFPSTRNASFGRAPVGGTSNNFQSVEIENLGSDGLNVSTSITGANASDFQVTTPCTNPVAGAGFCDIELSFTPAAAGPAFATLTLIGQDNATGGTATGSGQTIALSGTGVAATTSKLLPSPVVFPNTPLNTTSAPVSVFLSNTGTTADFISSITITPATQTAFQLNVSGPPNTQECNINGTLNAQGTCVVSVTFTPNTTGTSSAMLVVTDSATGTPQQVLLTGGTPPLSFTSTTLPNGAATVPYGADIQVTGGAPPYTFALSSGALPTGFTLVTTQNGNVNAGHVFGNPAAASNTSFGITVTDSAENTANATVSLTITAAPPNTQASLLKGQYALLIRSFGENGGASGAVGSLTFDGVGAITGVVDVNDTVSGLMQDDPVTGTYSIGPDNRGFITLTAQTCQSPPCTLNLAFSVGNTYRGIASTARITQFNDNDGNDHIGTGLLRLQDPTVFNQNSFPGTFAFGMSGLDTNQQRVGEAGIITFDNALHVVSGSADLNDAGTAESITSITGTYTAPDTNGRTVLTLSFLPAGSSSTALYVISANEAVLLTLDPASSNILVAGSALRQQTPGAFTASALTGPDVISLEGLDTDAGKPEAIVGVATASAGNASITYDENDAGTLTSGGTFAGPFAIAASGRATITPTGDNNKLLILYFTQPDTAFALGTGSDVVTGPLVPQLGAPFSASPFTGSFFFGQQETVAKSQNGFSGVGALASGNSLNVTIDESDTGGDLQFDEAVGTVNFAVAASGHLGLSQSSGPSAQTGYLVSPYEFAFFETIGNSGSPSGTPKLTIAQTQAAPPGTPSPAIVPVPFPTSEPVGSTTASPTFTITNSGLGPLGFSGTGTPPDYAFDPASTCISGSVVVVQPGGTCTVVIDFKPQAAGNLNETLTITTDGTSNVTFNATGTATGSGTVTLAPASLTFAPQVINTTSNEQTVTVTNTGASSLTFTAITASGDFQCFAQGFQACAVPNQETANAPCSSLAPLASNAKCDISVSFTPTATGNRTGTLTITDNATGSPQTATLTGTGLSGTLTATPNTLAFGTAIIGSTPPTLPVTVSNGTALQQSVFNIALPQGGPFTETDNCGGAPLAPGATCTIMVTFTPTTAQTFTGNMQISLQQIPGSPGPTQLTVALSGTGSNATFTLTIAPNSSSTVTTTPGGTAAVGVIVAGTTGIAQTITLTATTNSQFISTTVTPSTIKLTGTGNTQVAATLETFCRGTSGAPGGSPRSIPPWSGFGALLAALLAVTIAFTWRRQPRWAIALALLLLLGIGNAACGGDPGPNGPTPPGTYPVTLTATSGQQVVTLPITLVVQ